MSAIPAEVRFERDIERLHSLGPRALLEMLREIGAERLIMTDLEARVARYARRLDPSALKITGGDKMPPRAPFPVPRR